MKPSVRLASSLPLWCAAAALAWLGIHSAAAQPPDGGPRARWNLKFQDFVIGAWWGPSATDPELELYRAAGFNVVMSGRYMQLDDYGNPDQGLRELDLAQKHGLGVLFDTYTKNEHPWGGQEPPAEDHPVHHAASLAELKWLYQRLGSHPALIGFMIGDDQGEVSPRSDACTQFLFEQHPQLTPWLCGWIQPQNLAEHNNPIADPQIYPTLYQPDASAEEQARQYASTYASWSRQCRDQGVIFWPMFNVTGPRCKLGPDMGGYLPSDSLVRFPGYAAIAYGAEGIWYFIYNSGALQHLGPHETPQAARRALTPLYQIGKRMNLRIASWGPRVLGRTSTGLFGTSFGAKAPTWPFAEDLGEFPNPEALARPAPGKLVEGMDDDLLVGVLTKRGEAPLAMVVDCRVSKEWRDVPSREVTVHFAPQVTSINVLEGDRPVGRALCRPPLRVARDGDRALQQGSTITLRLEAGGGQLLELAGRDLDRLCSTAGIYAAAGAEAATRHVTEADLAGLRAAKLRIDCYGSDGGQYAGKYILLNGQRLAQVPAGAGDRWSLQVVDLAPEQLGWLRLRNEVTVDNASQDAWKFRNLTLAVQLADGTWVRTNTDETIWSVPNWAFSEGRTWGADGIAGPIVLEFE